MKKVLLVEDDRWLADCYRRWLEAAGYRVRHATDAQQALDFLDETRPHVIVLDMLLGAANGVQLLHHLNSYPDTMDVPVVLCSGVSGPELQGLGGYGVRTVLDKATVTRTSFCQAVAKATNAAI